MRALEAIATACLIAATAAGCSAIAKGSKYMGGTGCDAGICIDLDGGGNLQQQLLDLQAKHIQNWCTCFSQYAPPGFYNSVSDCEAKLTPPTAYDQCVLAAYQKYMTGGNEVLPCIVQSMQDATSCETSQCTFTGGAFDACGGYGIDIDHPCMNPANTPYNNFAAAVDDCATNFVVGNSSSSPCQDFSSPFTGSTVVGYTNGAGNDFDIQVNKCFSGGAADLTFQWESAHSGPVLVDTAGSQFDTVLYLLDSCPTTTSNNCNDDFAATALDGGTIAVDNSRSTLSSPVNVTAGTPITVLLDGYWPSSFGAYQLNFTALWCVDVPDTTTMTTTWQGSPLTTSGMLDNTATDKFQPATTGCAPGSVAGDPDIVIPWTVPKSGTYTIDTLGSDFDTVLYLRRSCDPDKDPSGNPAYIEDACNDDISGTNSQSRIQVDLLGGETELIVIDTKDASTTGTWHLNISGP